MLDVYRQDNKRMFHRYILLIQSCWI